MVTVAIAAGIVVFGVLWLIGLEIGALCKDQPMPKRRHENVALGVIMIGATSLIVASTGLLIGQLNGFCG